MPRQVLLRVPGAAAMSFLAVLATGCALGRDYARPPVLLPEQHRGDLLRGETASLADLAWWELFEDPVLQRLLGEAVAANHDLAAAAARVEQARQLVRVARSDMLPQLSLDTEAGRRRGDTAQGRSNFDAFSATLNLAWEVDLWGRIRRRTEAARADFFAAEELRRGVLVALVADVARAYFDLLGLDLELQITRDTAASFARTVELFERRFEGGVGNMLEVSRARAALTAAEAQIPDIEQEIVVTENRLNVLLGRTPGPIPRGEPLRAQPRLPEIPVGLPSQLLERRPDVRQAEQAIVAANAEAGAALADFFPRFGLTSLAGGQSPELENLVKNSGTVWGVAGSMSAPLFQGGRLLASWRASKARYEEMVSRYEQATLQAFAEVSSALIAHQKLRQETRSRQDSVRHFEQSVNLSLQRYNDGISSYFEVLEAQQQYFPAALNLARTQRDELVAVVLLYRALGGGWEREAPAKMPAEDATVSVPARDASAERR